MGNYKLCLFIYIYEVKNLNINILSIKFLVSILTNTLKGVSTVAFPTPHASFFFFFSVCSFFCFFSPHFFLFFLGFTCFFFFFSQDCLLLLFLFFFVFVFISKLSLLIFFNIKLVENLLM
jgi:hypothetical protein